MRPEKHSLTLRGHRTSVSLEAQFWKAFLEIATQENQTINGLAAQIDEARGPNTGLATAIPLHLGFQARGQPIVGTSPEYFSLRRLEVETGRHAAIVGECVLGARAARQLGLGPGDKITSSPETVFDLAGVYPLRMKIVGVLAPSWTADDEAVFVDVRTAWIIQGLGHGHQDLQSAAASTILQSGEENITANASLVEANEITDDNIDSFHFHGDIGDFPLSAVLVVPPDQRSETILRGRWEDPDVATQMVVPNRVIRELLDTVLTVQSFILAGSVLMAIATLSTAALVFWLSLRLRSREILTFHKIGGSRRAIAGVLASEAILVLALSVLFSTALVALVARFAADIVKAFVLA
jgi:putative ABC transport system permease protein